MDETYPQSHGRDDGWIIGEASYLHLSFVVVLVVVLVVLFVLHDWKNSHTALVRSGGSLPSSRRTCSDMPDRFCLFFCLRFFFFFMLSPSVIIMCVCPFPYLVQSTSAGVGTYLDEQHDL
jgi:hypothetical protein